MVPNYDVSAKTRLSLVSQQSRFGFVAICGRPNVGKSSLVNRLVGAPLAAVTPKAQTTRHRITGIYSAPGIQIVFHDTPGLHSPRNLLGQAMVEVAKKTVVDADAVLLVIDSLEGNNELDDETRNFVRSRALKSILAINKIDLINKCFREQLRSKYMREELFRSVVTVSALTGEGLNELFSALLALIPQGQPMYPEDELSDLPMRFFAGEVIREQILRLTGEEIPYVTAVTVEEFQEREDIAIIKANLHCERQSQKKILIGRGGERIKKIGITSRRKIEDLLQKKVHLELFVKISPGWTKDPKKIREFGYSQSG